MSSQPSLVVLYNLISVKDAAEYSRYSLQYIRRLLREGKLDGLKVGQVCLVDLVSFNLYLERAQFSKDARYKKKI